MVRLRHSCAAAAVLLVAVGSLQAKDPQQTVDSSATVLKEFLDLRVKGIPASLLAEAHGVAIVPGVIKVGLVVGGQRGRGVVIVREKEGLWRAPTFITLTGGSIGWQAGAQSTDVVLVFKTPKSVEGLLRGKFTIGADAAAAAGPVGRRAGASTDAQLSAEIYSYSRTRGLFAGVSLDGSVIEIDDGSNAEYYGVTPGRPAPESAVKLVQLIAQVTANPELIEAQPAAAATIGEPTPAGPMLAPASAATALPALDANALRQELSRSSAGLAPLLDNDWRRYLALPAEVDRLGKHPSDKALQAATERYDAVAADPQYRPLAERPEFQATRNLLHAYRGAVRAGPLDKLALPPPPRGGR